MLVAEFDLAPGGHSWLAVVRLDFQWLAYWQPSPLTLSLPSMHWDELMVRLADNAGIIRLAVKRACLAQSEALQF